MTVDIINQLINHYSGGIANLQAGSITLGRELFNAVAVISVAMLGINHLLKRNVDMVDAHLDLIKWIVYLNFFYLFIVNFSAIYSFVYSSVQQIGNYLGADAAGRAVDISPANILHIGIALSLKILGSNITLNLFRNLLYPLVSVLTAGCILFCFASIGLELILVQIGSQIILAGGIFLLAFSGLDWTRDYAERYVHTFFHVGIKMIFIYILVGLGVGLAQGWSQVVVNAPWNQVLDYDISVGLSTFIYYKLCTKIPDQAVSWLTGRLSMGFDTATAVSAAAKSVPKMALAAAGGVVAMAGMAKAVGAAGQAARATIAGQGKKESTWNILDGTVKTLGAAHRKETWDKKVDESLGGKMTKDILADMPPVPPAMNKENEEGAMDNG